MVRQIKTEAIVLRKKSLLHKDFLIFFFTEEFGKIVAIAKGIKKITSRRSPHIQTGNLLSVILHRSEERMYLQGSELISAFSSIKSNEKKIHLMYIYLFLLERILPENQKEDDVYVITKKFFIELSRSTKNPSSVLIKSMNDMLMALGYITKAVPFNDLVALAEELIHEKIPTFDI